MGLANWLLKNGPGSPGSTAKVFAKQYNSLPKSDHDTEWRELFTTLCIQRIKASSITAKASGSLYSKIEIKTLVEQTEGCLALFVFEMMYIETRQFRDSILKYPDNFFTATKIIYETIIDNSPTAIKFTQSVFKRKAINVMSTIDNIDY